MRFLLVLSFLHAAKIQLLVSNGMVIGREVTSEVGQVLVAKDDKFLANGVDEVSVMGHQHYRWRIGTGIAKLEKKFLKPDNAE